MIGAIRKDEENPDSPCGLNKDGTPKRWVCCLMNLQVKNVGLSGLVYDPLEDCCTFLPSQICSSPV